MIDISGLPRPAKSRYRVPFDESFRIDGVPTAPPDDAPSDKDCKRKLETTVDELREHQRRLYADNRYAVLAVFQALDAAGKDSTIRAVTRGVNPAGFQVFNFKAPSSEELDHDFLWRSARRLPERGRIGIFNRSYYEEVLVVRVHPEFLAGQRLPGVDPSNLSPDFWEQRLTSIRDHEAHLARNGIVVVKFFLNVSKDEQKRRFLSRIDEPEKNWKFSAGDLDARARWDDYMAAFEPAIRATSRPWAPWYAIPADNKPYMRMTVAKILRRTFENLSLEYPTLPADELAELGACRKRLEDED